MTTGTITNKDAGGYLQTYRINTPDGRRWIIGDNLLQPQRVYTIMMPEFLAQGKEKNLEFLGQFDYSKPTSFHNHALRNDLRDLLIAFMQKLPKN